MQITEFLRPTRLIRPVFSPLYTWPAPAKRIILTIASLLCAGVYLSLIVGIALLIILTVAPI